MHRRMVFQFARDVFYRSDIYNRMLRRHGISQIHARATDPLPGDPVQGAGILGGLCQTVEIAERVHMSASMLQQRRCI